MIKIMKLRIKILLVLIILSSVLFSAAHIFLMLKGKPFIVKKLEELTHKKVSIGQFGIRLPLNLEIKDFVIADLLKADNIFVSPSLISLLAGKIVLNNIRFINPKLNYERVASQPVQGLTAGSGAAAKPGLSRFLVFKRLSIKNGKIEFVDHTTGPEGIKITIKDLNFNFNNLSVLPYSSVATFELKGRIPWQEGREEGKIEAGGWLNLFKKNMEAALKIEDIDGIYLYPYYSNWVDLEKARIEKADLNFSSNIQGMNNNVTAECHLELTDIVRRPRPDDQPQEKAAKITDAVLDMFRTLNQGKIVLDFTIRTKMDSPEFGFGNIKMAFENKLMQARGGNGSKAQEILMLPGKALEETAKGAADFSRSLVEGIFAVGNEFKELVSAALRKFQNKK